MVTMVTDAQLDREPDETHTAAAGAAWGQVMAWRRDDGQYVIRHGDSSETNYSLAPDADDLAGWLELDGLPALDALIQRVNNRGIAAIVIRDEPDADTYYVLVTHAWLDGTEHTAPLADDRGDALEFATYDDAAAMMRATTDAGDYYRADNEAGRPTYTIIAL